MNLLKTRLCSHRRKKLFNTYVIGKHKFIFQLEFCLDCERVLHGTIIKEVADEEVKEYNPDDTALTFPG